MTQLRRIAPKLRPNYDELHSSYDPIMTNCIQVTTQLRRIVPQLRPYYDPITTKLRLGYDQVTT